MHMNTELRPKTVEMDVGTEPRHYASRVGLSCQLQGLQTSLKKVTVVTSSVKKSKRFSFIIGPFLIMRHRAAGSTFCANC